MGDKHSSMSFSQIHVKSKNKARYPSHLRDDRYSKESQFLEGDYHFQRGNGHVPYLHLIGHLRLNKIHVLSGGGVSSIADGRVYLLFLHSLGKGGMDSVLRYMVEE